MTTTITEGSTAYDNTQHSTSEDDQPCDDNIKGTVASALTAQRVMVGWARINGCRNETTVFQEQRRGTDRATRVEIEEMVEHALTILPRLRLASWERLVDAAQDNPALRIYVLFYAIMVRHGSTRDLADFVGRDASFEDVLPRPRLHLCR